MYEHYSDKLASRKVFQKRVLGAGSFAVGIFLFSLIIGMSGYHFIVRLSWIDSFMNASMILGGMGQVSELHTDSDKIFASLYALFSGVAFLSSVAIFLTPLIHRFLHKFHMKLPPEDDLEE
ncbi:MAG: hypothetical protein ABI462_00635 [Ignavibacteria bacterium]